MMSWAPCREDKSHKGDDKCCVHFSPSAVNLTPTYLGDVAGSGETKRHRADGFRHEPHGNLIPTIPHCLDGLADVPVVVSHADVLRDRNHKIT